MLTLLAKVGLVNAPVLVKHQRPKLRDWHQQSSQHVDGILHQCSMTPDAIREEVELFKTDFNKRVTEVLFHSMCCAYYMAFVPVCFAEVSVF